MGLLSVLTYLSNYPDLFLSLPIMCPYHHSIASLVSFLMVSQSWHLPISSFDNHWSTHFRISYYVLLLALFPHLFSIVYQSTSFFWSLHYKISLHQYVSVLYLWQHWQGTNFEMPKMFGGIKLNYIKNWNRPNSDWRLNM